MRCICTFEHMSHVWAQLAEKNREQAYIITAKKRSAMYKELEQKAHDHMKDALTGEVAMADGETFIDYIRRQRADYSKL